MPGMEDPARATDAEQIRHFLGDVADLASSPGGSSDATVKQFLVSYPLTFIFRMLELHGQDSTVEHAAVTALERVFSSSTGKAILPQVLPYVKLGLSASSPAVRKLSCSTVRQLLAKNDDAAEGAVSAVKDADVARPLLAALADSDTSVATVAGDALADLARLPGGLELLFTNAGCGDGELAAMAATASATVRMRALSLAAAIAATSEQGATAVAQAGIPAELQRELQQVDNDLLTAVNVLEVVKELASSSNGAKLVASAHVIGRLCSMISSPGSHSMIRLGALAAGAELLIAKNGTDPPFSSQDLSMVIQAVESFLTSLEGGEEVTKAAALDTLGKIGASRRGADVLLTTQPPTARHVAVAAFHCTSQVSQQLAALHALASIAGAESAAEGERALLSAAGESSLQDLVYSAAATSPWGPTLMGVLQMLLHQTEEVRIAAYRLVGALVGRPWAVQEICSSMDIVIRVTDPQAETNRTAMEWRHACCVALSSAAAAAEGRCETKVPGDIKAQLDAAVRRGPYLTGREAPEAQPMVATMERM